ncbi:MAG: hypothetical protein KDI79_07740 [Anaerolineae bacterium]|nr:hypothetical protein [Anaerolineae bacterium]
MKLGIPPKEEPLANNKPARSTPAARPALPAPQKPPLSSGSGINLGILSQKVEETVTTMNLEEEDKPNLDLAARLAGFSPDPLPTSAALPYSAELLRLLRDQHGRLIVEVDGRQYSKLTDVADKKVGQYILDLTAHLLAFTNGVVATPTGIKSLAVPKTGDLPMPMISRPADLPAPSPGAVQVPPPPPEDAESKLLASLKDSRLESETLRQKSGFFGIAKPAPAPTVLPALNLADEINDIVQARLRSSSLEKNNVIAISSDPGGGIRIKVNDRYYASPDEITDPAVRDLIKSSIKEWERR